MRQASIDPVASCFMLGLKSTHVTVSLWPLKCLSSAGSSCERKFLVNTHPKAIVRYEFSIGQKVQENLIILAYCMEDGHDAANP